MEHLLLPAPQELPIDPSKCQEGKVLDLIRELSGVQSVQLIQINSVPPAKVLELHLDPFKFQTPVLVETMNEQNLRHLPRRLLQELKTLPAMLAESRR